MPESRVRPPLLTLTTVLIVAPAPEIPEKIPAKKFPIPCPISSRLLLCFVLVILSATTEVNKVSIEPNPAKVNAGIIDILRTFPHSMPDREKDELMKNGRGKSEGIAPMILLKSLKKREKSVTKINAVNVAGIFLVMKGKR